MKNIIRGGINYGELVVNELEGARFATESFYAAMLGLPVVDFEEIPEFNIHLHISTLSQPGHRETLHYVFDNADVRRICEALSKKTGLLVRVYSHARILASYRAGELLGDIRTLDSFYSGLSQEEIVASTF